ncbi:MFS transporter [Paraliomyxa miuraensis]|uniref:MFS transporter n=1 Tax=Paraliomyxa miuraensis TaxID=376150 RepID=UPI00224F8E50|nr:MFS transporter [Paraliomyxa miuraensis]MCX4246546.1 MFS transporter [Paraliomyxa miuraensis]
MLEGVRRLPRPLAFLYAGTIATRLGTFVVPYLTIYLSVERGLSLAATGRILAAGGVGLLLGNLAGGQLADRVGRKAALLAALLVNVIGVGTLAVALPWGGAYAVALAVALAGAGMWMPAANALIADATNEAERGLAYTVHYVCINIGMGLGPLLGGLLAASSFHAVFVGDIATSLVCAGLIAVGISSVHPPAARSDRDRASTLRVWTRHPRIVAFCGVSVLLVAPLMGLEYAVPILVATTFDEALVFVGVVYSINAACILGLSFPIERALRGRNEAAMMAIAGALWAGGLAILAVGASIGALLSCTVVWTLGEIVASIVVPTYVSRRVAAHHEGRMLALQDAVRSGSAIVCPIALGAIWDGVGVAAVLGVLVALPAAGSLVYLVWWRATARAPDATVPVVPAGVS